MNQISAVSRYRTSASWGTQTSRQTKTVWHSTCTGPIACNSYFSSEKPQFQLGGFSSPRSRSEKEGLMEGFYFTSLRSCLVQGSAILYLWEHARQNLQTKIFLVAQSIGSPLQNPNLITQSLDKTQRHLVLRLTVGSNAIPMADDHQREIFVGSQTLPLQGCSPVLH